MNYSKFKSEDLFTHVYQPIYNLLNYKVLGYEAFIRVDSYKDSIEHFFLEAKKQNYLYDIDIKSIEFATKSYYRGKKRNEKLFLNVFQSTLLNSSFISFFEKLMNELGISLNKIVLEINEGEKITHIDDLKNIMNYLKGKGVMFAIDDFGKGSITIKQVIELEPKIVKLDQYFANNLFISEKKQKMIKSLVDYFDKNTIVILEGIESPEELAIAKVLGITNGQGYLLGKPKDIEDI